MKSTNKTIRNVIQILKQNNIEYQIYKCEEVFVNGEYKNCTFIDFMKKGNKKIINLLKDNGFDIKEFIIYEKGKDVYIARITFY